MSLVTLQHGPDRAAGLKATVGALWPDSAANPARGQKVLIKPNFNTADPSPGSTHNVTLLTLVDLLWEMGAASITVGERSWRYTRQVMETKGILPLLAAKGVEVLVFDELPEADWVPCQRPGFHWPDGVRIARPVLEAPCLVEACCLKTHAYGGVFTMSLKLATGVVPGDQQMPSYMTLLHSSPHQRLMLAELNSFFSPALVVVDGVDAFIDGGPSQGQRVTGDVTLASADRVAIDAVGVAMLMRLGANPAIMSTPIWQQEQIARAVELGLGAAGPEHVELVATDPGSQELRQQLERILREKA